MLDLKIFGDITTVLEGKVSLEHLQKVDLKKIAYGLGSGTSEHEVGEAIIFKNKGYLYLPQQPLQVEETLFTPFMMGIERQPNHQQRVEGLYSLAELYDQLLQDYPQGFALVGEGRFSLLEVAFLKKTPRFNENINTFKEKYWVNEKLDNVSIFWVAFVLPYPVPQAFYINPHDKASQEITCYSHSHALVNNSARHLLTQSIFSQAKLWVEEIKPLSNSIGINQ